MFVLYLFDIFFGKPDLTAISNAPSRFTKASCGFIPPLRMPDRGRGWPCPIISILDVVFMPLKLRAISRIPSYQPKPALLNRGLFSLPNGVSIAPAATASNKTNSEDIFVVF